MGEVLDSVTTGEGWEVGGGEPSVLLQCLQLQVVSVCVRLLREAVSGSLERLVYQLLSRRGSPVSQVSLQALSALSSLSSATGSRCVSAYISTNTIHCGEHYFSPWRRTLSELICQNADYLVNSVCLALRSHTHSHEPLQVLQAVMEHGLVFSMTS